MDEFRVGLPSWLDVFFQPQAFIADSQFRQVFHWLPQPNYKALMTLELFGVSHFGVLTFKIYRNALSRPLTFTLRLMCPSGHLMPVFFSFT